MLGKFKRSFLLFNNIRKSLLIQAWKKQIVDGKHLFTKLKTPFIVQVMIDPKM